MRMHSFGSTRKANDKEKERSVLKNETETCSYATTV